MANVGYATLQIIPSARGFGGALGGQVNPQMDSAGRDGGRRFGGAMVGGLGKSLTGVAAPLAAVFGGAALISSGREAISLASDFSETLNKSNVIFGDAAGEMEAWSRNSVKALGLSQGAALATGAQFGDMFTQLGFGSQQAAVLSQDILKLSADIGSFQNADTADVATAFQSALRGEYEAIQRYLPGLKAARVEQEAMAQTGKTNAASLTAQEKATALYSLANKDGASALNDFSETQGGLAGQQKILSANIENLKTKFGSALLPAMTGVTTFMNTTLLPALGGLGGLFKDGGAGAGVFSSVMGALGPVISTISTAFQNAGGAAGIFQSVIGFLGPLFSQAWAIISPILSQLKSTIKTAFEDAGPIINALKNIFLFVFPLIWAQVKFYMTAIGNVIKGALTVIQGVIQIFSGLLTGNWGKVWEGIKNVVSGALQALWGFFNIFLMGRILGIASRFAGMLGPFFGRALSAAGGFVTRGLAAIFGFFRAAPSRIISGLANLAGMLARLIGSAMSGFLRGAQSGASTVVSFMAGLPGRLIGALGNLSGRLVSAGGDLLRGLANGISGAIGGVVAKAVEAARKVVDGVKNFLGINSPSRVFMEIGGYTAEGMALGIEKGAPRVSKAMNALTALPSTDAAFTGAGGAPSARGGLIGSLTIQSQGSVRDDLGEVEFMLRRINRGGTYA